MPKIMLIDAAQAEETRVAVMDGKRLDNFDIESASKKQLKGNIYLAKVTRVEPSLQAAFVNYGGNRHGFLPFAEIHPDYYRIPVEDRERLLAEQEELHRQMQEEARQREEREAAEAEAAAQNPNPVADEHADEEDVSDEAIEAAMNVPTEEIQAEDIVQEQPVVNFAEAEPQDDLQDDSAEGDDDLQEGEELPEGEQAEGAVAEGEEGAAVEGEEGGEGRNRGRRGNNRRGRNRRGRGRGADRQRPDRLVDQSSAPAEDDDSSGMDRLWKRMRRSYKIQEVIKRGQIMLIQVVKEERGNKGAAVTTYITMPGRYCVLMPNSPQSGGVSRKVASHSDRKKMREMLEDLQVPQGMSVILRTAGVDRAPEEVKRDLDYLMRLWDRVRDTTMESTAPSLIHEEGSLVKRAVRDLYSADIKEIIVEGDEGAKTAREVMDMMMPDHVERIRTYNDSVPLFTKYGAEPQIDAIHSTSVTLRSGGYIVINPTEALVSIDINSGRATRERHIEETALKTNLEAADEIGRQLRLRDLGGLVVIDFIDMESRRNNAMVEKRIRDALSGDRARVQIGRISSFGLLELSRQRLRPSLTETHFQTCPHCRGTGMTRTTEALALAALRAIETAGMEGRAGEVEVSIPEHVAMFLFNHKRSTLSMLEQRYDINITIKIVAVIENDHGFIIDVTRSRRAERIAAIDATVDPDLAEDDADGMMEETSSDEGDGENRQPRENRGENRHENRGERREDGEGRGRRRGRRGGRNRNRNRDGNGESVGNQTEFGNEQQPDFGNAAPSDQSFSDDDIGNRKMDAQGNEFDGNAMGSEQAIRSENRGGRNRGGRGRGRDRGQGGRDGNREGGRNRNDRGRDRGPRNDVPDNIGNQAPREEMRVTYDSNRKSDRAQEDAQPQNRDYERVNEVSGDKKKGWWKKLTG